MQSYPRRQPSSQPLKLVRTLPPEAEGVEELVVNRLDDLTHPCNPPPKTLGPASLFGVSLGRVNNLCPVAFEPTPKACYELGRKPHRNADSTFGLVTSRSPFPHS